MAPKQSTETNLAGLGKTQLELEIERSMQEVQKSLGMGAAPAMPGGMPGMPGMPPQSGGEPNFATHRESITAGGRESVHLTISNV